VLSGSNYSLNLFKTLLHFPIKFNKIIIYEIISGMGDLINLLFIPFYAAALLIPNCVFGWNNILTFITVLVLFLFSVNSIIYLFKNILALISFSKYARKLLFLISISSGIIFLTITNKLNAFLQNTNNIILTEKILNLFPSGIYLNFIMNINSGFLSYIFLLTLSYFLFINISLLALNIYFANLLRRKNCSVSPNKNNMKKSFLTRLSLSVKINPITKKDLVYTLRCLRTMLFHLLIVIFLPILLISYKSSVHENSSIRNIINQFSFSILYTSLIVISFAGNIFAFDGKSIINYFFRPISYTDILKSKTFISNFYIVIILFANLILFIILRTGFIDIIFCELLILLDYILLLLAALPLSIYFPKEVNYWAMNGFLTSFINLFILIVITVILWFISQAALVYYIHSNNKILLFILVCFMIAPFYYYKEKIIASLSRLLSKRKEKIITVFR